MQCEPLIARGERRSWRKLPPTCRLFYVSLLLSLFEITPSQTFFICESWNEQLSKRIQRHRQFWRTSACIRLLGSKHTRNHDKHKLCSKKSRRPALNWTHRGFLVFFISKFSPEWVYFDALSRHSPWQTRCCLCIYFSPDWWLMPSSSRYESTQGGSPGSAAARRNATVGVSACWESEQQSTLGGGRGVRR